MSDRISNFPDELLLHILSSKSLQTKHVATTTLLSKRWTSLWLSIPKLEFRDTSFYSYASFLRFVEGTLDLVHLKSLKMFVLMCERFDDVSYAEVPNLVNTVVTRSKLEYLNLWFPTGFDFLIRVPLPSSVFNCNSIRILKLARVNVGNLSTFDMPLLKTLHLFNVEFPNGESLAMLLSKCIGLEELLLLYVELPDDDEYTRLDIGRFHHLIIAEVPVELFSIKAFSNVTFLSFNEVLSSQYVQHDFFPGDSDIPTFYNLTHLEIGYLTVKGWTNMVSCLRSFPRLETLIIKGLKGLDWPMETSVDVPPCISSHLKIFYLGGFHYLKSEFEIVRFIMRYAKVLRSLIISTLKYSSQEADRSDLLEILSSYPKRSENCSVFVDVPAGSVFENVCSKLVLEKDFSYFI